MEKLPEGLRRVGGGREVFSVHPPPQHAGASGEGLGLLNYRPENLGNLGTLRGPRKFSRGRSPFPVEPAQ